jgi:hypothetical protein
MVAKNMGRIAQMAVPRYEKAVESILRKYQLIP